MTTDRQPRTIGAAPSFNWPYDENGNPMVMITMQASELVGLPSYSNVTVGPASVTRFVKEEDVDAGLKVAAMQVESIISSERTAVLEIVAGS